MDEAERIPTDGARQGLDGFVEDLTRQHRSMQKHKRVPTYERLLGIMLELLPKDEALRQRLGKAWARRNFFAPIERPLLFLSALRFDALRAFGAHPLHAAIAASNPQLEAITEASLSAALQPQWGIWESLTQRFVQTNETSRAVAWLWPVSCIAGSVALMDLGASAGLNLMADALPNIWQANGVPCDIAERPDVVLRLGLDARPMDVTDPDMVDWLRACIWPGETQRLRRLDDSVRAWCARDMRQQVLPMQAEHMPKHVLQCARGLAPDVTLIAYQTLFRDFLSSTTLAAYNEGMRHTLGVLPAGKCIWVELENHRDGDSAHPVALTAHLRDASGTHQSLILARTSYHPTELHIDAESWKRFAALVA